MRSVGVKLSRVRVNQSLRDQSLESRVLVALG